ncbi:hypothetical protein ACHCAL_17065 [Providencia huaxiensis]|uniref:hypothetical protein n=1 Tax=Providencia huaxiensis TaxID=2027290 RepID=UPI00375776A8
MNSEQAIKNLRRTIWDLSGQKEAQAERVLAYLKVRVNRAKGLVVVPHSPKPMTFMEAIKLGYIRQQGNWKDAPWVFDNRIMPSASAALDEANRQLKAHWAG